MQDGLDQVWTAISHKGSKTRLSGMDTYTYIQQMPVAMKAKPRITKQQPRYPWLGNLHLRHTTDSSLCPNGQDACRLLTLDTTNVSDLFLIQHQAPGRLGYLHPASCGTSSETLGTNSRRYQVPVQLNPGDTTLYAIGVTQQSQKIVARHLSKLPKSCNGETRRLKPTELNQWLARLDQIMQQQPNISWSATRTRRHTK